MTEEDRAAYEILAKWLREPIYESYKAHGRARDLKHGAFLASQALLPLLCRIYAQGAVAGVKLGQEAVELWRDMANNAPEFIDTYRFDPERDQKFIDALFAEDDL